MAALNVSGIAPSIVIERSQADLDPVPLTLTQRDRFDHASSRSGLI